MKQLIRKLDLRSPLLWLVGSLALTISYSCALVYVLHQTQWQSLHRPPDDLRFEQLRTVILQLDDVLTLNTRMAAASGEPQWRDQHAHTAQQLETALRQTTKLASDDRLLRYAHQVDAASDILVDTENKALALVLQHHQKDARALLFSPAYDAQKHTYADATNRLVSEFRQRFRERLQAEEERAQTATWLAVAGSGLALAAWIAAIAFACRAQRKLADRVHQRTAELADANTALVAAEAKYRGLLEELPAIAYVVETEAPHRWTYVSPKLHSLLGFTPEEWSANPLLWRNQLHTDDRKRVVTEQARCAASGERFTETYRLLAKDGRVLWFSDHAIVHPGPTGQPGHFHGLMIDVTAWKDLEEQVRQVQKVEAIGRLAGGVAHDFNNILTVIAGFATLILQDSAQHPLLQRHAGEIERAAYRGSRLTRQLLAFSRKQVLAPRLVDLGALVADLARLLQRLIGEDIHLQILTRSNLSHVRIDPGQLEQVILNLVINARDAMPQGGTLSLETSEITLSATDVRRMSAVKPGLYALLRITDTGHGMSEEVKTHLFEPFFTTKPAGQGAGLNLATCFGIVKQSGGHIEVESQPGAGATFRIYLPRAEHSATTASPPAEVGAAPRGTETILLVEDEDAVRDLAQVILGDLGYRVLTAADGAAALELAQQNRGDTIDLLVTDLVMPQLGGKELAETLRAAQPNLPVLFVSGYSAEIISRHGVLARDAQFLNKPYTPGVLARKIREILDQPANLHAPIRIPVTDARPR